MSIYCPHIKDCGFYKNWKKQTKNIRIDPDKRKNVIVTEREGESLIHYDCRALISLNSLETGISMNDELKSKLSNPEQPVKCYHITVLNYLTKLGRI